LRRVFSNTVYVEGWALYCEELMYEEGFYTDPKVRLLQLKDVLWRAARVVADVGLHCKGMGFEEAVDLLVKEAAIERVNAVAEVKRYTMSPTQPLSYLVGKLAILKLREKRRAEEGSGFSLKAFHDSLLSAGALPMKLVEEAVGAQQPTLPPATQKPRTPGIESQ